MYANSNFSFAAKICPEKLAGELRTAHVRIRKTAFYTGKQLVIHVCKLRRSCGPQTYGTCTTCCYCIRRAWPYIMNDNKNPPHIIRTRRLTKAWTIEEDNNSIPQHHPLPTPLLTPTLMLTSRQRQTRATAAAAVAA